MLSISGWSPAEQAQIQAFSAEKAFLQSGRRSFSDKGQQILGLVKAMRGKKAGDLQQVQANEEAASTAAAQQVENLTTGIAQLEAALEAKALHKSQAEKALERRR